MPSPADEEDRWIRCFHPRPESRVQLVCFPHAGGSATYYFAMSRSLASDIEVLAIQYPGRQDRRQEPHIDNVPELADRIFAMLRNRLDRQFAFFGHSMGAVLAFEVARRFEQSTARRPCRLFVSGRVAPSRRRNGSVHTRADAGILSEMRKLGGTDERFLDDEELMAAVVQVTRNDYRAIETYVWKPDPPLACSITVLVGDNDPQAPVDDASAWAEHSSGEFDLRIFPGGHFYLDAQRDGVVETISATLGRVSRVNSLEGAHREV